MSKSRDDADERERAALKILARLALKEKERRSPKAKRIIGLNFAFRAVLAERRARPAVVRGRRRAYQGGRRDNPRSECLAWRSSSSIRGRRRDSPGLCCSVFRQRSSAAGCRFLIRWCAMECRVARARPGADLAGHGAGSRAEEPVERREAVCVVKILLKRLVEFGLQFLCWLFAVALQIGVQPPDLLPRRAPVSSTVIQAAEARPAREMSRDSVRKASWLSMRSRMIWRLEIAMPRSLSKLTYRGTVTCPCTHWEIMKRLSSAPKCPTIPSGRGATTVSPEGNCQRSHRHRIVLGCTMTSWTMKSS